METDSHITVQVVIMYGTSRKARTWHTVNTTVGGKAWAHTMQALDQVSPPLAMMTVLQPSFSQYTNTNERFLQNMSELNHNPPVLSYEKVLSLTTLAILDNSVSNFSRFRLHVFHVSQCLALAENRMVNVRCTFTSIHVI